MGRLATPAVLLVTGLLAGCTAALPDPVHPEEAGTPWTDPGASLWVARDRPCGFGSGADEGCATLTLVYRDGSVLRALYGQGGPRQLEGMPRDEGARGGLTFAFPAEHDAYRTEIQDAWTAMHGEAPDLVRVHNVTAHRLSPDEREGVLRVIEHALRQADPLPAATFDCQDCAAPSYWAFGKPRELANQEFGSPAPDDKAWRLLEQQVDAIHDWLDGQAATP